MNILITGGTGFLGQALIKDLQKEHNVFSISRNEFNCFNASKYREKTDKTTYYIGDIRDYDFLDTITDNMDIIIHTAAMRIVDVCEKNIEETIKTNLNGSLNIFKIAKRKDIKVIHISTDKALSPVSVYGATKLIAERMAIEYKATVIRPCNLKNARGTVMPAYEKLAKEGKTIKVRGANTSRFMIDVNEMVAIIKEAIFNDYTGHILIPKNYENVNMLELAKTYTDNIIVVERRDIDKEEEILFTSDEKKKLIEQENFYII